MQNKTWATTQLLLWQHMLYIGCTLCSHAMLLVCPCHADMVQPVPLLPKWSVLAYTISILHKASHHIFLEDFWIFYRTDEVCRVWHASVHKRILQECHLLCMHAVSSEQLQLLLPQQERGFGWGPSKRLCGVTPCHLLVHGGAGYPVNLWS